MNKKHEKKILIDHPKTLGKFKQTIAGRAWPAKMPIRVMILAQDGLWYSQPKPRWHGHKWKVRATLGYNFRMPGTAYGIVAVEGDPQPEPVTEIPECACQSEIVDVRRAQESFN